MKRKSLDKLQSYRENVKEKKFVILKNLIVTQKKDEIENVSV